MAWPFDGSRPLSGVMKQILLGIPPMLSEIGLAKSAELRRRHFSFSGKVFLFQDALDPDVDRKRPEPLVSKEHHTISNLRAHAGQLAEAGPQ